MHVFEREKEIKGVKCVCLVEYVLFLILFQTSMVKPVFHCCVIKMAMTIVHSNCGMKLLNHWSISFK